MKNLDEDARIDPVVKAADTARPIPDRIPGDRRRPGRMESVSPELIPLLRGETTPGQKRNDLHVIQGIAVSVVLSLLCYAGIWTVVRYFVAR